MSLLPSISTFMIMTSASSFITPSVMAFQGSLNSQNRYNNECHAKQCEGKRAQHELSEDILFFFGDDDDDENDSDCDDCGTSSSDSNNDDIDRCDDENWGDRRDFSSEVGLNDSKSLFGFERLVSTFGML
mmetsp:Transcript_20279/g.42676  ORF Transcript_20279/g.42676 Transcript_20279/m.42676 type:complete len:130 (-) Transcript_20279:307-696(-)